MHLHIPDGVLPAWLWVSSIIILLPLLALAVNWVRKDHKRLVLTSAITALMLVVFSVELLGYHLNFTALAGILLGPWWSLISITVANTFLALFGHGGITVAPLNILLNWCEALVGYAVFRLVIAHVKSPNLKSIFAGLAALLSLSVSFLLFIWIVSLTGINPGAQLEQGSQAAIPLTQFVAISIIPTIIGAAIESLLTFLMFRFILKTRPGLLK